MKKIVFALIGFSSLMILSCRQQEDILDSEDINSLKVLEAVQSRKITSINSDTVSIKKIPSQNIKAGILSDNNLSSIDGEGDKPPR